MMTTVMSLSDKKPKNIYKVIYCYYTMPLLKLSSCCNTFYTVILFGRLIIYPCSEKMLSLHRIISKVIFKNNGFKKVSSPNVHFFMTNYFFFITIKKRKQSWHDVRVIFKKITLHLNRILTLNSSQSILVLFQLISIISS